MPDNSEDFLSDLQSASRAVGESEKQRGPLLRELLFKRADEDSEFRKSLEANPQKVVEDMARGLGTTAPPELVQEVKQRFSTAIFGATDREVKDLVFGTLSDVRESFERTLKLSQFMFWFGLALTVAAFAASLFPTQGKAWIAGVFGGGGILALISSAVMNPLDRIRNAAANLVQMQIAYVSYYKQLSMLGGLNLDKMSLQDAVKYSTELRKGALETIEAVQKVLSGEAPQKAARHRSQPKDETPL